VNTITTRCGVVSLLAASFGCVSTCLTGPSSAVLVSGRERSGQYTAAIALGSLAIVFGLLSPLFTELMLATPPASIATLAGLALLRVLQNAFEVSFQGRFTLGALVAFLVTLADHPIYNIGAPFWGLVFGFLTSWLLERKDFSTARQRGWPAPAPTGRGQRRRLGNYCLLSARRHASRTNTVPASRLMPTWARSDFLSQSPIRLAAHDIRLKMAKAVAMNIAPSAII